MNELRGGGRNWKWGMKICVTLEIFWKGKGRIIGVFSYKFARELQASVVGQQTRLQIAKRSVTREWGESLVYHISWDKGWNAQITVYWGPLSWSKQVPSRISA